MLVEVMTILPFFLKRRIQFIISTWVRQHSQTQGIGIRKKMERWKRKEKELIVFTKVMVSNPVFLHPKGPTKDAIYTQHSQEVINNQNDKRVPTEIIKYNVIYSCIV